MRTPRGEAGIVGTSVIGTGFSFVVVFLFVAVVFATLYAVLDRFSGSANFSVAGQAEQLDFPAPSSSRSSP